ncbi:MAG: replicative DNA helicase [Proteobacteria bacterium]|nr:replicative DNA helicase [Pseudomonadota bacterium]
MAQVLAFEKQESIQPLHNLEAEQSLLGALMLNNQAFEIVAEYLRPEHFSHPLHKLIFEAMTRLVDRSQVADPITLKPLLDNDPLIIEAGGIGYLVDLVSGVSSTVSVRDYAKMIHDFFLRRSLSSIGDNIMRDAHDMKDEGTAMEKIEGAEKQLYDLASSGDTSRGAVAFKVALTEAVKMAEIAYRRESSVVGVTTGLLDVDKWLGGLHPSDLLILAGRPSMGKTALATNIAFNAAKAHFDDPKDGGNVAFFSLEMSAEQLATRILSTQAQISSDKIRRGEIRTEDFPKIVTASRLIENLGLYIDDTPALSITAVRNRARRLQRQHGISLIVVDYLQLLESSGKSRSGDNRVQEISDISRGLKALAKELNVPVLALSQLSRAVEQREDKRPQLSDLRESGSIEQDADVVMFVYRDEYYEARKEPPIGTDKHMEWQQRMSKIMNQAEVIVAKQRHGPVGTVKLYFDGKYTRFGNLLT